MEEYADQQHHHHPSTPKLPLEETVARKMEETKRKQQAGQKHKLWKYNPLHSKLNNNYTNHTPMHFWKSQVSFNLYINM